MDKQKQEALLRMRKLGLPDDVITQFEEHGVISQSTYLPLKEEALSFIKELNDKHNVLIYFVIHAVTGIGEIDSCLFVDANEERWASERAELENNRAAAYFGVRRIPQYSAFCTIGFETVSGSIRCTGRADL